MIVLSLGNIYAIISLLLKSCKVGENRTSCFIFDKKMIFIEFYFLIFILNF